MMGRLSNPYRAMTYLFTFIATAIAMFGKGMLAQLFGEANLFNVQCWLVGTAFVAGAALDARSMLVRRKKKAAPPERPATQP